MLFKESEKIIAGGKAQPGRNIFNGFIGVVQEAAGGFQLALGDAPGQGFAAGRFIQAAQVVDGEGELVRDFIDGKVRIIEVFLNHLVHPLHQLAVAGALLLHIAQLGNIQAGPADKEGTGVLRVPVQNGGNIQAAAHIVRGNLQAVLQVMEGNGQVEQIAHELAVGKMRNGFHILGDSVFRRLPVHMPHGLADDAVRARRMASLD